MKVDKDMGQDPHLFQGVTSASEWRESKAQLPFRQLNRLTVEIRIRVRHE